MDNIPILPLSKKVPTQTVARMKHYYHQRPLSSPVCHLSVHSLSPINSSQRWGPLSSPGLQQACNQPCPSEWGTSQSQKTLRFAIPEGLLKHNVSWSDTLTPQGLILQPSGDAKASKVFSLTSEGDFCTGTLSCTDCFCLCAYTLRIYYSKSGSSVKF